MSQGLTKQASITEQSVEMTANDFDIDDIIDIIDKLESVDVKDDINQFEFIAQTEMQNLYTNEIEKTKEIILNSSINGNIISAHCNNQQELEEYLTNTFGEIWYHNPQKNKYVATSIQKNINKIKTYSVQQMLQYIAYFDISMVTQAISDGNWDENKFKLSSKKQWNDAMANHNIPRGISIKLYKAINTKFTGPKRVIFDDEENKYYNPQQQQHEHEEKQSLHTKLATIADPNDNNLSTNTIIIHSMTPEPPANNTFVNFSDWKFDKKELKFPTYISKALYYLSEDYILELLIDRAISKVLSFDDLWRDATFCHQLYHDDTFKEAVDRIYKCVHDEETQYDFINDFIEKELSREIANYQKAVDNHNKSEQVDNKYQEDTDENDLNRHNLEVQLSRSNMEITSKCLAAKRYKITILDEGFDSDSDFEWALFRRKTLRNVYMQNMRTSGYWKILTKDVNDFDEEALIPIDRQDSFEMDEKKEKETGGFPIFTTELERSTEDYTEDSGPITRDLVDLNAILMFLQTIQEHLTEQDKDKIIFTAQDLKKMKQPIIRFEFEAVLDDENDKAEEKNIDEAESKALESNKKETTKLKWYDIYWWNSCEEDNQIHALALKNHASKGKMEYYLRYVMGQNPPTAAGGKSRSRLSRSTTNTNYMSIQQEHNNNFTGPKKQILEWIWYDNDTADYKRYDLGTNVLKQLEASFHSNCSHIFPKQLNCNFNYLLLREMAERLRKRGRNVGLGYVLRFSYSNSDRFKIVNMEQLSVWRNAPEFARNVQRRINGRNSIFMYFSSNNSEYVDEWKNRYLLYTEDQQKYFWAHVLAVSAATHYISTEIKNQVIAFNFSEQSQQNKNLVFAELNDFELQKEQRSYMEYPGFLITPKQFLQIEPDIFGGGGLQSTFQYLIKEARAVVLQKFNTNVKYNKRSVANYDIKQHCPHPTEWKWRNAQQQFYCDECAALLHYAEFVRKFILEFEHPDVVQQLWPWYRNTFHHNDFIKYHNYISRYNLSTLYTQSDILQMRGNQPSGLQFDGCFKKMKVNCELCTHQVRTCACCHAKDGQEPRAEENIRYRRKFAARFLLGGWNISRNLNIIRQQLKLIFTQLDKENEEATQRLLIHDELSGLFPQKDDNKKSRLASKVTMHRRLLPKDANESELWIDEISAINENIPQHYHYECGSIGLKTPSQLSYFAKFTTYCLKAANDLKKGKNDKKRRKDTEYEHYYNNFLVSWIRTPKWYTISHDIILLRLALLYNLNEKQYVSELNGDNSLDYQQLLTSSAYYDNDKPFHEFSAWCERWENIFHRLRYLTHCIALILSQCSPSIINKRIPQETDRPFTLDTKLNSIVFLDSIMYETHLKYCKDEKDSISRNRDSDFSDYQYSVLPVARRRDPFIVRNLLFEFKEVLYAFDLYKHGKIMGQFLIDRLETKQRKSLWVLLGTLLKRMPYHMSLQLLTKNRDVLRRGEPKLFDTVCNDVINGTNFSVPTALYLSSLMEVCAEEDLARHSEWISYSKKYEELAAVKINTVESDHVISILLDARIFMDEEGLLELALESRRLHFLNSETINGVISHMWQTVDFSNPHSNPSFKPGPLRKWQLFQLLLMKPFYFYLSPLGFSWTIGVLFIIYCVLIGIYLKLGIHQIDPFPDIESQQGIFELFIWICGVGYLANELKEYLDQGTTYFSVNLSNNIWDIALSVQFIILFSLRICGGFFDIFNNQSQTIYDILWAIQCVFLAVRTLRLFQTSVFLGPLLHVVGLMVSTLIKFLIIIVITFCGFVVGIMYINNGDNNQVHIFQSATDTAKYLFELAVGMGSLDSLESLGANERIAQVYIVLFVTISSILLLNLLIALMTTEYSAVEELALAEAAYLKAQSCYDLKHRSRYIPPPLNWMLYAFIFCLHILNFIPALLSPCYLNIYAHLHKRCMNPLRSHLYRHWHHPHDSFRAKQQHKHRRDHNKNINKQQFERWDECNNNVMNTRLRVLDYYWKSLFAAWAAQPCCSGVGVIDWKIFHVNCYNVVSNGTNNVQNWNVMPIAQYFHVYEQCTQSTLDPYDKTLVTHLTSNSCVFCKFCSRSITTAPKHIKSQLLTPFWVLADIVSIWCFLLVLYVPMCALLFVIGVAERLLWGSINDHHIMSVDDEDDKTIQYLSQNKRQPNKSVFNLNAKKKRKLRDYGKQYYRKTATNFDYLSD